MAKITEEYPETALWIKCEELCEQNEKAIADDPDYLVNDKAVAADKRFDALYDLARDLSSQADELRERVLELEADDDRQELEDAILDVLHEYPNLVRLRHPLLRRLHDALAPGGLLTC